MTLSDRSEARCEVLRAVLAERSLAAAAIGPGPLAQWLLDRPLDWRGAPDLQPPDRLWLLPVDGPLAAFGAAQPGAPALTADGLRSCVEAPGRIAVAGFPSAASLGELRRAWPDADWTAGDDLADRLRAIKEPDELSGLRRAAELTDECLLAVVRELRPGQTMRGVELEIEFRGRRLGAEAVSFPPFCGFMHPPFGPAEGITNVPTDWPLRQGTAVCFDVGFVVEGWCSDWGRSVHVGPTPAETKAAYRALCESVREAVSEIRPGETRACEVYPMIERGLDRRGFGDDLRRRLGDSRIVGHSIGVEVHERPWLGPSSEEPLLPGMVLAIEPKLWRPGAYYLRLEEIAHLGESGAEFLTRFPHDLFEL